MNDQRSRGIDEQIRKAMEAGKFDHLSGKGKPLDLSSNPHVEPEWQLANKLLNDAGYAPDFIEMRRSIEEQWNTAREKFLRVKEWYDGLEDGQRTLINQDEYKRQREAFEEAVANINKKIADYNLTIPSDVFWRAPIDPDKYL